jgi:phosphate transport system substrate-binding protein
MTMKKMLMILLLITLVFSVACSASEESTEASPVVDQAAIDKAEADKKAAEEAVAKAEAEAAAANEAAEKAAAEKAAAEKALADAKTEAEKLAAEKAATEATAKEKAAAEAKKAADLAAAKAAADKAAADKAKAEAEKTVASAPTATPTQLKGTIQIDGSSTVYPFSEATSELFSKLHKDVRVPVGVSGTGGGFKRFCSGETDISNASRTIKSSEADLCKKNGVEYIELAVTYDGLTVVINKNNTWASNMTVGQLKELFKPNSTVKTWKDLNPAWPAQTIKLYSPGADSGTFDYFTEAIVGTAKSSRNDSQISFSEDDNVLVQGVSGDVNAIGYFGFSYYEENMTKLNAVSVDNTKGPITPTFTTISNGSYAPLSRELYIYVSKKSMDRPEVKAYVNYSIDNAKTIAKQVGFVPLPDSRYTSEKAKLK